MSASIDYSYNTSHRWFRLPTEIRQQILLQLNTIDLIRLLHVCKGIYNVIKIDCLVWRHLFRRSFPACDAEEDWMTWRFANDLSSTMPYTGHSYDVATGTRGRFHNNNNNNSNNTWRPSSYNKHSHIDWWQLFWERIQLERNWRRGCFDIDSISLPTNDVTSSSNGSTFGLDVLATRAWGTLFGQCMTNAWIVVHVAGQPISPMSRLEMPIPTGESASSTIRIVSAIMTTQGSILIHGRLSSTIASDDEATQITSTLFDTDHLWLYRLNSTTLSYCRIITIEQGSELIDARGRWALWRHSKQPGSMTHCICDLDSGVYWPVLALSDSNEAGYLFAGINRDGTRIQLETDDNGAIVADTAHLHMIDDGKVQIFQCRYLNSCWFCWELVEHTIINEMFSGTSTMTRYNHNDNDHSYRAHRQTRIVARGALFLSHNGPLQRVFTQYISKSLILLQYNLYNNNATCNTYLSAINLVGNQIQWEFLNLRLQRIIPVPERDFIVICDAKKRYLIRHLESGLPHYMDSWPAEAQLEQTIGSVFLLGNYGRNEHILHDIISGDRLFTLSGTEPSVMNSLGKRERLLDKDDVDTPPANSLPCTATCRPLLTSPVHLGQIDNRAGLFHYWAFA